MLELLLFVGIPAVLGWALWDRFQTREPTYRVYPILGRLVHLARYVRRVLHSEAHTDGPFRLDELREIRERSGSLARFVELVREVTSREDVEELLENLRATRRG